MNAKRKNNAVHHPDSHLKQRFKNFNNTFKEYLSKDLIYLTEKRDDYENQILHLKIEKEQRNKTLFQHVEQKDIRKYFSPLNLSDMDHNKKDDKQKELSGQIQQVQDKIARIDAHIEEIHSLIREMDTILEEMQ